MAVEAHAEEEPRDVRKGRLLQHLPAVRILHNAGGGDCFWLALGQLLRMPATSLRSITQQWAAHPEVWHCVAASAHSSLALTEESLAGLGTPGTCATEHHAHAVTQALGHVLPH